MARLCEPQRYRILLVCFIASVACARAQNPAGVRFAENRGQIVDALKHPRPDILFSTRSRDAALYLRSTGLSYVFVRCDHDSAGGQKPAEGRLGGTGTARRPIVYRMDMELVGANADAEVTGDLPSSDHENFYPAHCPSGILNVRSYGRVTYHDIYPYIDLVYHSARGGMKYDFIVHPGGRTSDIALRYVGATDLHLTEHGTVNVASPFGGVEEGRPEIYQRAGGSERAVRGSYLLNDSAIGFTIGDYDRSRDLVIDPTLHWSTYLGGSGWDLSIPAPSGDQTLAGGGSGFGGNTSCSDGDTTITVTGRTESIDFPVTPGVAQTVLTPPLYYDIFVARFSTLGNRIWATYLGGSEFDGGVAITVDPAGSAYAAVATDSPDYPTTTGAFQRTFANSGTGALTKFDNNGRLVWSTYYQGAQLSGVQVDHAGNVIVCGRATALLTATPGAFQGTPPINGGYSGFITKFNSTGSARIWSTFFGGTPPAAGEGDSVKALSLDSAGNIYVCGGTMLTDFPVSANCAQPALAGLRDAYIGKFDPGGNRLWCTYLGGGDSDVALDVAATPGGVVTVVGSTRSSNFPVSAGAFQGTQHSGTYDGFVAHLAPNGALLWATYYGGTGEDYSVALDLDARGSIWSAMYTESVDLPVTQDAYQPAYRPIGDVALVKFDSGGTRIWATYLGGSGWDVANGISATPIGVIVNGTTSNVDFPTTPGAFQPTSHGGFDIFMTAFCDPVVTVTAGGNTHLCAGDSVTLTATSGFDHYLWPTGATTRSIVVRQAGTYGVTATVAGSCTATAVPVAVSIYPVPVRTLGDRLRQICDGDSTTLATAGGIRRHVWSTGDTTATLTVRRAGKYSLFFVDTNGCSNYSDTVTVVVNPRPTGQIVPPGPLGFCDGSSVVLDAGGGYQAYRWSSGDTVRRITVTKAGQYTVRVQNAFGCWSDSSNTVNVRVYPLPKVTIRNLLPTVFCEGDSTILVATPGTFASYLWSTGTTSQSITVRTSGDYSVTVTDSNGCVATAHVAITVTPGPHPVISASGPLRFCAGDSVTLSTGDFSSYQWSTGATSQSIVAKTSGKYFVIVMNAGGCSATSDPIVVEVLARPDAAINGPVRVCPNTFVIYTVPFKPGLAYQWTLESGGATSGGLTANAVSVLWGAAGSGVLRVHVTDPATGCSADTAITVTIGTTLKPVITTNRSPRLCAGDSVTLDAGSYAGYLWSTGATSRTITVGAPGRYAVWASDDSGCHGTSDSVTVTVNAPPQPMITVPNGGTFCTGDSIVLDAGAGYTGYLWSNGFTSRSIVVRASGTYTVTVTDSNGCTGLAPAVTVTAVPLPSPVVSGPTDVCRNSVVSYTTPLTPGSGYQWNVTGGTLQSGQGSAAIRVRWGAAAGAGRVDLTETTSGGCRGSSAGLDVTIGDHLTARITPAGPIVLCPGSTLLLDAGAGYAAYAWSTGATTQTIDVGTPGSYSVIVSDSGGCSGTSAPVDVVAGKAPVPIVTPGGPLAFCEGDSVALRADAGYADYRWSTGATTQSIVVKTSGRYTVTVTDASGCTGTSAPTDVVVHPRPVVPPIVLGGGILRTPSAASAYQWLLDGLPIAGATSDTCRPPADGVYRVVITDAFGCSAVSDPVRYRSGGVPHIVKLDTVAARVGDRVSLVMHVQPGLTVAEAVHGYHADLRFDSRALFIHDVISPDRSAGGEMATYNATGAGLLSVDRPASSPAITGDELFRVELEGLVSGQPLNVMAIDRVQMPEAFSVAAAGDGLVILSGCELGTSFEKHVQIVAIRPNPLRDELVLEYWLPSGKPGVLRLYDGVGREIVRTGIGEGTGENQEAHVDVRQVPSGIYEVELRNGAYRSAATVVVLR
ncbi:MAG: hypothetical protein JST22_19425 [Bacteroidetes bacterium]|nr:hypothetical protein [Bacteroidota bacterium]